MQRDRVLLAVVAVLLGVYGDVGSYAPGVSGLLPELGTPWVLLAFAGGRVAGRAPGAVLAGPALILLGLASYWSFMALAYGVELYQYLGHGRGLHWLLLAVLLGSAAGLAGRASAAHGRWTSTLGWAFAAGVPVVEAAYVLTWSDPRAPLLAASLVPVAVVPLLLARRRTAVAD